MLLCVGDPDDKRLRRVEKDVLVMQKLRDKTRSEKCIEEVKSLSKTFYIYKYATNLRRIKSDNSITIQLIFQILPSAAKNRVLQWYSHVERKIRH